MQLIMTSTSPCFRVSLGDRSETDLLQWLERVRQAEGKLPRVKHTIVLHSVNLWDVAEFLLQHDVVNAINLDGGGSATFVLNGTLASYPSDHW